jgi:hypothetical protein
VVVDPDGATTTVDTRSPEPRILRTPARIRLGSDAA